MKHNPNYVLRQVAEEAVLISLENSRGFNGLYGLNELGLEIYRRAEKYPTDEALIESLIADYDAPPEEIARDARAFLEELRKENIITD